MRRPIPAGITPAAILEAAAYIDAGRPHPFGPPTRYEATVGSRRYPPKALIGIAAKLALGLDLGPANFSSGTAPGQAVHYLRELGFPVLERDDPSLNIIGTAASVIEDVPGWLVLESGKDRLKACHEALIEELPAVAKRPALAPKAWLTLDFEIQDNDTGLGMFWFANQVTDLSVRNGVLQSLLDRSEETGFTYTQGDRWRDRVQSAFSGQRISDGWWGSGRVTNPVAAEQALQGWIQFWSDRMPAIVDAVKVGTNPIEDAVGKPWSDEEVNAAIAVYFEMLSKHVRHETFVKKRYVESLMVQTHGRSRQSCEFKLRNISAVLTAMGLDYLSGYVPADNFQQRLADLVAEYLEQDATVWSVVEDIADAVPTATPLVIPSRAEIEEAPPAPIEVARLKGAPQIRLVVDVAKRDAANKALGKAGEAFVVELERAELNRVGRPDLAARVRWVADVDGDGLGYDILSYAPTGEELYIEVKTTNGPKTAPFYVTANEVAVSAAHSAKYNLYRVFQFSKGPRLCVVPGSLTAMFRLDPIAWRASFPSACGLENAAEHR